MRKCSIFILLIFICFLVSCATIDNRPLEKKCDNILQTKKFKLPKYKSYMVLEEYTEKKDMLWLLIHISEKDCDKYIESLGTYLGNEHFNVNDSSISFYNIENMNVYNKCTDSEEYMVCTYFDKDEEELDIAVSVVKGNPYEEKVKKDEYFAYYRGIPYTFVQKALKYKTGIDLPLTNDIKTINSCVFNKGDFGQSTFTFREEKDKPEKDDYNKLLNEIEPLFSKDYIRTYYDDVTDGYRLHATTYRTGYIRYATSFTKIDKTSTNAVITTVSFVFNGQNDLNSDAFSYYYSVSFDVSGYDLDKKADTGWLFIMVNYDLFSKIINVPKYDGRYSSYIYYIIGNENEKKLFITLFLCDTESLSGWTKSLLDMGFERQGNTYKMKVTTKEEGKDVNYNFYIDVNEQEDYLNLIFRKDRD